MELALLMLLTGALAVMALIGSLAPEASPIDGALSDLDIYILENSSSPEATATAHRVEDFTSR